MPLRSAGLATELMLARFDGEVVEREEHVVVRTPSNPRFWFGNFVLFAGPPAPGDGARWERIFAAEIGGRPGVEHVNLAWDAVAGEVGAASELVAAGYELIRGVFLAAERTRPAARDATVRPLATEAEWRAALAVHHAVADPGASGVDPGGVRAFQAAQHARYRLMAAAGFGHAYGAFVDGRLVGTMGVFGPDERADAVRCQSVAVHPDFQRRGLGAALVHGACGHALAATGAGRVWMYGDPDGRARRVYEAVGFRPEEHVAALARPGRARARS